MVKQEDLPVLLEKQSKNLLKKKKKKEHLKPFAFTCSSSSIYETESQPHMFLLKLALSPK